MSPKSAGLAKKMGYTNVKVFLQGQPAWKKAGNDVVASDKFVQTGNTVLLDVRTPSEEKEGHIPRAVNIPMTALEDAEDDFPKRKTAPIVIYGNNADARKAVGIISGWGYKKTALVDGGLQGYVARGGKLTTEPAASEIVWKRKLGEGEVTAEEFMKAAAGNTGQIILDVRTNEEIAGGKFNNSVHVPLDELEARIAELPKDKELLVHCTTGARAQMAHDALKKAGMKSRFLVADVECENAVCELVDE
jgi:rhodanese-related sulfurtransferase